MFSEDRSQTTEDKRLDDATYLSSDLCPLSSDNWLLATSKTDLLEYQKARGQNAGSENNTVLCYSNKSRQTNGTG